MFPFFDSLTHPSLLGEWFKGEDSSFKTLNKEYKTNKYFIGACAVNNPVYGMDNSKFFLECSKYKWLYPVARVSNVKLGINEIKIANKIGFKAIKIHPRQLKIKNLSKLNKIFALMQKKKLILFLCTYYYTNPSYWPSSDYIHQISKICNSFPKLKIVLLHGGGVRLIEFIEFVRFNKNILLDLSLTFMKYNGSSIEKDINFAISNFDKRICIGSDHPEYKPSEIIRKISRFKKSVDKEKIKNVSFKNIKTFLEI